MLYFSRFVSNMIFPSMKTRSLSSPANSVDSESRMQVYPFSSSVCYEYAFAIMEDCLGPLMAWSLPSNSSLWDENWSNPSYTKFEDPSASIDKNFLGFTWLKNAFCCVSISALMLSCSDCLKSRRSPPTVYYSSSWSSPISPESSPSLLLSSSPL
jgi:hypothetical protein